MLYFGEAPPLGFHCVSDFTALQPGAARRINAIMGNLVQRRVDPRATSFLNALLNNAVLLAPDIVSNREVHSLQQTMLLPSRRLPVPFCHTPGRCSGPPDFSLRLWLNPSRIRGAKFCGIKIASHLGA